MTQRNNSGNNRLHHSWQRSLPAQSLCWLSSVSLLSSGLVYAQEAAIDNIVPTAETSNSAGAINKVKKYTNIQQRSSSTPESTSQPDFTERRAKLRQRLSRAAKSQPADEASTPTVVFKKSTTQAETSAPKSDVRSWREKLDASRRNSVTHTEEKPQPDVTPSTAQNPFLKKVNRATTANNGAVEKLKDFNNAYIDPTEYRTGGTYKYEAPNSVVLTGGAGGCRTILGQGQGVSDSSCVKSPLTPSRSESVANSDSKQLPSWISKSKTAHSVNVISERRVSPKVTNSDSGLRSSSVAARNENNTLSRPARIASGSVTKSDYHRNRFIPNDFTPTTTVNSATPTPKGGALPPPITSENEAPRPGMVAYNIPLASTLPQVAYAGRPSYGVGGLMFPLPVPAEITSLFGWRIHPITGDRRFHSGTDLGAATGTPVLAANRGQVEIADWVSGYGLTVILNHSNAQQTLYGHMSQLLVQPGQWVEQGTVIGLVGSTGNSTGPHLHFEMRQLTQDGWVATDPGADLQNALSQLVQTLQTARTPQTNHDPGS